jgi:hypothetical protein
LFYFSPLSLSPPSSSLSSEKERGVIILSNHPTKNLKTKTEPILFGVLFISPHLSPLFSFPPTSLLYISPLLSLSMHPSPWSNRGGGKEHKAEGDVVQPKIALGGGVIQPQRQQRCRFHLFVVVHATLVLQL